MRALLTFLALFAVFAAGCSKACPDHADCPKGATCKCDRQGRLEIELRDIDGDKKVDSVTHQRNEAGQVIGSATDFGDNGSIERHVGYELDSSGRRLKRKGWQLRCDDKKFFWECTYEEPCPPPYDACTRCPNQFQEQSSAGLRPCGPTGAASTKK